MFSSGKIKRSSKHISRQIISLVLVLAMMLSLPVPVELFAAESPSTSAVGDGAAKDENIYAVLYRKDGSNSSNYLNLELVFQNSDAPIAGRAGDVVATYRNFAGTRYHSRDISLNSGVPEASNSKRELCPWNDYITNIVSVDFKDEIEPTYIAGWFYGFRNIREFKHLSNLKTGSCKDMSYAFYCSTNTSSGAPEVYELDLSVRF